jgi:hypothetical protein
MSSGWSSPAPFDTGPAKRLSSMPLSSETRRHGVKPIVRWRRLVLPLGRVVVLVSGVLLLGHGSNALSAWRCQLAIAARLENQLGRREVFVLSEAPADSSGYPGSEAVLSRAGFRVRRCTRSAEQFDCFPWAGIARTRSVWPFIAEVEWGFVEAPLSGAGMRTRFFTFFGLVFEVGEKVAWVT